MAVVRVWLERRTWWEEEEEEEEKGLHLVAMAHEARSFLSEGPM
jgi:hypothetical protein